MYHKLKKTFVRQQGQSDCGVACLASIIKYYGGYETLEKLRALSGTSVQGTTLLGLFQAAQNLGFEAEGLEAEGVDNLSELAEPAILHVIIDDRLQHYFTFYGNENGNFLIGDPARGIVRYTKEELNKVWQSKALLTLRPNEKFIRKEILTAQKKKWLLELVKEDFTPLLASLFLGILISGLGLSTAIFSQKLIDTILPSGNSEKLILSLALVTILLLARTGLSYLRGSLIILQSKDFNNRIISKFYKKLLRLPKSFFDTRKTGELIARMNDTRRIQAIISFISGNMIIDFLLVIVSLSFVLYYSWGIGLILLGCFPVYLMLVYWINSRIVESQQAVMSSYALTEGHYVDTIQGIASIKTSNREGFFNEINQKVYGFFQQNVFKLGKLNIRFSLLSDVIGVIFIISVFGVSSWMVLTKVLQLGEMVAILSMAGTIIPAVVRLSVANIQIQEARVAFDRMFEFTSIPSEYRSQPLESKSNADPLEIEIENLSFRFPGRKQLLKNISLKVKSGEMIALLGESGSGKSTLIQIIQKFYSPEQGTMYSNRIPIEDIPTNHWRRQLGVVPQDIKIFNGNLLYNITLSDQKDEFEKAILLCKQYGFDTYFESLPQSYLTLLGEEGINISGGQRQLVALARALFSEPKLLLLDEATSAMDRKTEKFILNLLIKLKGELAVVMVTHRIKTAEYADRIYILENGEVKDSGSPATLLNSSNFYSESFHEQKHLQ